MALEIVRRFANGAWKTEAAEASGGSQPVGSSVFAVLQGTFGPIAADTKLTVTWNGTNRDPGGWLNPSPYDSPDWEGQSYLAAQTIILPPGMYAVGYHATLSGASITSVDGDFACVDNRLATTLADSLYAHGPSPTEDAQPNYFAGFFPGFAALDAEHIIIVPTDADPGLHFALIIRPHGDAATDGAASISIQKISDWAAASH